MPSVGFRDFPVETFAEESLGFQQYADALTEFSKSCQTPMTIALQGDWGSGKTSLMNLIRLEMEKESDKYGIVWFNTWQYSQFGLQEELPLSLISYFMDKLSAPDEEKDTVNRLKQTCRWFRGVAVVAGKTVGHAMGGIPGGLLKTAAIVASPQSIGERLDSDPSRDIELLKEQARATVERVLGGSDDKRIIVFIDDLDRLSPIKAIELLESFKLFLEIPGCVFILACDYQVVSQGLKMKFGHGDKDFKGKSFFDKIIQLPFQMPVAQYKVDNYIESLLKSINMEYTTTDIADYRELIETSIGFNPRNLKRVFNCLLLLNIVASKNDIFNTAGAKKSEIQKVIFATVCLQREFERIYSFLAKNPGRISEELFSKLQNPAEYTTGISDGDISNDSELCILFKAMKSSDQSVSAEQLARFMQIMYRSVQLSSDGDDKKLSEMEIVLLRNVLTFTGVTTTSEEGIREEIQEVSEDAIVQANRQANRRIAKLLAKAMNEEKNLDILRHNDDDDDETFLLHQKHKIVYGYIYATFNDNIRKSLATNIVVGFDQKHYFIFLEQCRYKSKEFKEIIEHYNDVEAVDSSIACLFDNTKETLVLSSASIDEDADDVERVAILKKALIKELAKFQYLNS